MLSVLLCIDGNGVEQNYNDENDESHKNDLETFLLYLKSVLEDKTCKDISYFLHSYDPDSCSIEVRRIPSDILRNIVIRDRWILMLSINDKIVFKIIILFQRIRWYYFSLGIINYFIIVFNADINVIHIIIIILTTTLPKYRYYHHHHPFY